VSVGVGIGKLVIKGRRFSHMSKIRTGADWERDFKDENRPAAII